MRTKMRSFITGLSVIALCIAAACDGGSTDMPAADEQTDGTLTFDIDGTAFDSTITTAERAGPDDTIFVQGTERLFDNSGEPNGERVVYLFVPAATGSFAIDSSSPSSFDFDAVSADGDITAEFGTTWPAASGTVVVDEVDEDHVSGTFSGSFVADDDSTAFAEVSSGAFDVMLTQ